MNYRALGKTGLKVSEIGLGGGCESRCPFGVHIIERMQAAADLFH